MPKNLEGYDLYIVKKNDGSTIRLANFWHILRYLKTGNKERTEVLFVDVPEEESTNELLQLYQIIWWSPFSQVFHEATRDDVRAEKEYQQVLEVIDTLPDINPESGSVGTLIKTFSDKTSYRIVDGVSRRIN